MGHLGSRFAAVRHNCVAFYIVSLQWLTKHLALHQSLQNAANTAKKVSMENDNNKQGSHLRLVYSAANVRIKNLHHAIERQPHETLRQHPMGRHALALDTVKNDDGTVSRWRLVGEDRQGSPRVYDDDRKIITIHHGYDAGLLAYALHSNYCRNLQQRLAPRLTDHGRDMLDQMIFCGSMAWAGSCRATPKHWSDPVGTLEDNFNMAMTNNAASWERHFIEAKKTDYKFRDLRRDRSILLREALPHIGRINTGTEETCFIDRRKFELTLNLFLFMPLTFDYEFKPEVDRPSSRASLAFQSHGPQTTRPEPRPRAKGHLHLVRPDSPEPQK